MITVTGQAGRAPAHAEEDCYNQEGKVERSLLAPQARAVHNRAVDGDRWLPQPFTDPESGHRGQGGLPQGAPAQAVFTPACSSFRSVLALAIAALACHL